MKKDKSIVIEDIKILAKKLNKVPTTVKTAFKVSSIIELYEILDNKKRG